MQQTLVRQVGLDARAPRAQREKVQQVLLVTQVILDQVDQRVKRARQDKVQQVLQV